MFNYDSPSGYRATEDSYIVVRRFFYEIDDVKIYKILTKIFICYHILSMLLECCFLYINPETDITKYGPVFMSEVFVITWVILEIFLKKTVHHTVQNLDSLSWSIYTVDIQTTLRIKKRAKIFIYFFIYVLMGTTVFITIIGSPIWGSSYEFCLSVPTYVYFFGNFSFIPNTIFFITSPFMVVYGCLKPPLVLLYMMMQMEIQITLLNQHILKISDVCNKNLDFQKEILKRLIFCVKRHVELKKFAIQLCFFMRRTVPILLIVGSLNTIAVMVYIFFQFESAPFINKIRVMALIGANVSVVLMASHAGQSMIDETATTFDTLLMCSWYTWNTENRKIFGFFLQNAMVPITFRLAGISLDYTLILNLYRYSFSNALVLYNVGMKSR